MLQRSKYCSVPEALSPDLNHAMVALARRFGSGRASTKSVRSCAAASSVPRSSRHNFHVISGNFKRRTVSVTVTSGMACGQNTGSPVFTHWNDQNRCRFGVDCAGERTEHATLGEQTMRYVIGICIVTGFLIWDAGYNEGRYLNNAVREIKRITSLVGA
jgi:hypothetical protein